MRSLYKPVIFLLFSLISLTLKSQCYINLGDYSGATPQSTSFFEADACDLRSEFPDIDKFAVYDFGFYTETEPMAGSEGYESFLTVAKSQIHHDYYLLFARVNSPSGLNQRIIVEFKFPFEETAFNCLIEDDIKNFRLYLPAFCNDQFNKSGNADLAIKNTIEIYKNFIIEKKLCCGPILFTTCESCTNNKKLSLILKNSNFKINTTVAFSNIQKNLTVDANDKVKAYANFTVDGKDVKEEIVEVITEAEKFFTPLFAELYYFDDSSCIQDPKIATKAPDNSMGLWQIYAVNQGGKQTLYQRFFPPEFNKGPRTIHIVGGFNDINIEEVKNIFKSFVTLCGCNLPNITANGIPFTKAGLSKKDMFFFIGDTKNKVVKLIQNGWSDFVSKDFLVYTLPRWGASTFDYPETCDIDNPYAAVMAEGDIKATATRWGETNARTAAFIMLHSIGHESNYNFSHRTMFEDGNGIMSSGTGIQFLLTGSFFNINTQELETLPTRFENFENLIIGSGEKADKMNSDAEKISICDFLRN